MMPRRRVYGAQHGQGSEPAGRPRARIGYDHLEAAIDLLRTGGRAAICGMISGHGKLPGPGPGNLTRLIIKRLRLDGFLVLDHLRRRAAFEEEVLPLVEDGSLHPR
jgi:NADPH-dependent curcumin reductase CurA